VPFAVVLSPFKMRYRCILFGRRVHVVLLLR
jgi:hypothetical protein